MNRTALSFILAFSALPFHAGVASTMADWQSWVKGLSSTGYSVAQGSVWEVDNAACAQVVAVFGNCFGNNAAAPYIVPEPPVGNTYVDPWYARPFKVNDGPSGEDSDMIFRVSDNDAIVNIVSFPPQAAYFGYQSYVFSRKTSFYAGGSDSSMTTLAPPGIGGLPDARYELFGSLGNSVNNVLVAEQLGSTPWGGGPVVFITTANKSLAEALKADALAHGLEENRIFVEPIGANVLTGSGAAADDMLTLIRYALPQDADAGNQWRGDKAANVLVFRVAAAGSAPVVRYGMPSYTRKLPTDEHAYQASLQELTALLWAWAGKQLGSLPVVEPMISSDHVDSGYNPYGLVGADCISKGSNCLGDSQDTDAYRFGVVGKLTGGQMAIVTGVNHSRTGNASYTSVAVYDMEDFTGVASVSQTNPDAVGFDSGSLNNSAAEMLVDLGLYDRASAQLKADLPYLYATMVARSCNAANRHCLAIGTAEVPATDRISITQRAYIKPGRTSGADPDAMLPPIIVFSPLASIAPTDCFFNWAETTYPSLFAPAGATDQTYAPYTYRQYSGTQSYLGVSSADRHVYYLDPTGNMQDWGPLSAWTATAGCI